MYPRTTFGLLTVSSIAVVVLFIVTAFIIQRPVTSNFRDVDAIRGALAGEDVFCTRMKVHEVPQPEIQSYGVCRIERERVEMYVIDFEEARDAWADASSELASYKVLVGENWVLVTEDRETLEAAREVLGGDLR